MTWVATMYQDGGTEKKDPRVQGFEGSRERQKTKGSSEELGKMNVEHRTSNIER
jgi:hypothetical protein